MKALKTSLFASLFTLSLPFVSQAQKLNKKQKDTQAIQAMAGCFKVSFNFAETFNYAKNSDYKPSPVKHDYGLEWVTPIKSSKNEVFLQHILIIQGKKPFVMKHWRQDWVFEAHHLYDFTEKNTWKFVSFSPESVQGQWTQKVYQVDDSPRYEGKGSWVHVDGKSYWESTAPAPLPRREFSQRKDYSMLQRHNRHQITPTGWVHDQDNQKLLKNGDVLAEEKGFNRYERQPDSHCQQAANWWKENDVLWSKVRAEWNFVFDKHQNIRLKNKVDNKKLFEYLFALPASASAQEVKNIIQSFVKS